MSRSLKREDVEASAEDLGADLADLQDDDLNDLASSFNRRCLGVTNAHAPLRQNTLKRDGMKPWCSDAIHSARVI